MVLRRAVTAVAVVALLAVLVSAIYLLWLGDRFFAVQSDSMAPAIHTGDLVIVAPPLADGSYAVGQVITFHPTPGYTTTHRIADINAAGIETKGDANATPDVSQIQPGQVAGVVTAVIPYAGYAAVTLQEPVGWIAIALAIALVLLAWELTHTRKRAVPDADPESNEVP